MRRRFTVLTKTKILFHSILNKITPDKFNKLSDELLQCELDSPAILKGELVN